MKEDILEQLVDDYYKHNGYFTRHNVKFKPSKNHSEYIKNQDSNDSDIDVLAFHPKLQCPESVIAVSCKSWQGGFNPKDKINAIEKKKNVAGREAWKPFRELCSQKWGEAFINKIQEVTGKNQFIYVTAVTHLKGNRTIWENYEPFRKNLKGNFIKLLTLNEILDNLYPKINTTVAFSGIGRILQLIKASKWEPKKRKSKP